MRSVLKKYAKILLKLLASSSKVDPFRTMYETAGTAAPVTLRTFFLQKIVGFNYHAYWPCHFTSVISSPQSIEIGIGTAPGLSPNCYIQGKAGIKIGDYTLVGPGVGIISANHDIYNIHDHQPSKGVVIGKYCWLGMNAVILPGVRIGDHTIVAAGAIVTKSFVEGYCVLAGNPARVVKEIERSGLVQERNSNEYIGYLTSVSFYRRKGELLLKRYNEESDLFTDHGL
jgi:acetyltransferase-like isoleucine patch superfamily enzyme